MRSDDRGAFRDCPGGQDQRIGWEIDQVEAVRKRSEEGDGVSRDHHRLEEKVKWPSKVAPKQNGEKWRLTTTYRWFLSTWAKRLSRSEVASIFRTSWDSVCWAVGHAVEWGLAHRDLSELTAVGLDEVAWGRGHTYLTLVYDIGWAGMAARGVARPARRGTVGQA